MDCLRFGSDSCLAVMMTRTKNLYEDNRVLGSELNRGGSAVPNRSGSHCSAGKQTSHFAVRTSCYVLTRIPEPKNSTVSHKGLLCVRIRMLRPAQVNHPEFFLSPVYRVSFFLSCQSGKLRPTPFQRCVVCRVSGRLNIR